MKPINRELYRGAAVYGAGRALAAVYAKWPFDSLVISREEDDKKFRITSKLDWGQEGFPKTDVPYNRDNWKRSLEHDHESDESWRENLIRFSLAGAFSVRELGTNLPQPERYPRPKDVKLLVDVGHYESETLNLLTEIHRIPFRNSDATTQFDQIMQEDLGFMNDFITAKFLAINDVAGALLKQIKRDDTGHVSGRLGYDEVNRTNEKFLSAWSGI